MIVVLLLNRSNTIKTDLRGNCSPECTFFQFLTKKLAEITI